MIISLDPGVKKAGVAVFHDKKLTEAWLAHGKNWQDTAQNVKSHFIACYSAELVMEKPQVYVQSKLKGDPDDLIGLALMAGCVAGMLSAGVKSVYLYFPRQWKGQVPKNIMTARTKEKLSDEERSRVDLPAKYLQHNVWDAVGIGLYHLKRH